ncbi:MAG: 4Fe-4S binding protein [Bacteroidota bacterium]|nr:4Fe-4S binding protein [Bacteroidota bacterium]
MIMTRQKVRKTLLIISFIIFPATFYYLSPALIIEGTLKGIIAGSFICFVLLFVSSLFLGRAYCGWVCPASGIQNDIMQVNDKKIRKGNAIKWFIWTPWILTTILLAIKRGGYEKIDPLYQTTHGFSIGNIYALFTYLIVLAIIVIPAFIFGRRSFCHHICWMAPFMIIGRKLSNQIKLPSLQLISKPEKCVNCHTCTTNCPMSLPVEQMIHTDTENTECILCGTCVDGCKSKAIDFQFKAKK